MIAAEVPGAVSDGGLLEGYVALRIDAALCPVALVDDLRGIDAARWLAIALREDFETACYGSRVHGPLGTFDGVVAEDMPSHWRRTEARVGAFAVWVPDARHPLGKWISDTAAKLLPLPPPEILDAVLRRHGIEGSREPAPQSMAIDGGWAILLHRPRPKAFCVGGVTRDDGLMAMWLPSWGS